ncbi:MAG: ketoacyl-ACP synthase III [Verrucomicrobia bacterium]|nr:ketoacyl-ACP synthase III [Verrucomicrobiota bacterium]
MTRLAPGVIISGTGSYAPSRIVTNDEISAQLDTTDEWIRSRTGIKERRIAGDDESTSFMGAEAAKSAMDSAGVSASDIDLIIVATLSPDMLFPSTASLIQTQLGLRKITSFDLSAACSGFIYALEVVSNMMRSDAYQHALIIGSEKISSILDWEDRSTCVLFGDGAGAVVLSKTDDTSAGIIDSYTGNDGAKPELLCLPGGGSACPPTIDSLAQRKHFLKMNGREIFRIAVRWMEQSAVIMLERHGLKPEDISLIIPHQANLRIIHALARSIKIPKEKLFVNVERYGNTSAASIPIALHEARQKGCIQSGDYVLLVAFGAGLTWGSTLIKWH